MAAGIDFPLGSGLCVVINGNLKQRELTISFFISPPRGLRGISPSFAEEKKKEEEAKVHREATCARPTQTAATSGCVQATSRRVSLRSYTHTHTHTATPAFRKR